MSRPLGRALLLAPAVLAAGLAGPWRASLDALAAEPGAARLGQAIALMGAVLPLGLALLAARFHQVRLTLFALALAGVGLACLAQPLVLEGPGVPALLLTLPLALGLGSRLEERGVTSRPGLRGLALAGALALLPAGLALRHADDLALLLRRAGPVVEASPGWGVPWLALVMLAACAVACWQVGGRDGDVVGPLLAAMLLSAAGALWMRGSIASFVLLLGASASVLAGLLAVAWRRGFVDDLTQLPGRRALDVALDGLSGAYVVAVVDVDHFKRFNDDHGHDAGDDALRIVAGVLRSLPSGTAYRQGGEEFVAILPGASIEDAVVALEELRERIETTPLLVRGRPGHRRRGLQVTASIGAAARSSARDDPRDVLRAADQALLRAKRLGRNRVERERRSAPRPIVRESGRSSRSGRAPRSGDAPPSRRTAASRDR